MQIMLKHIFWHIIDFLACMLPELHAVKVLFYAESVVTFGHVTKMVVKPFDLLWPKTPCYMQTSRLYLL